MEAISQSTQHVMMCYWLNLFNNAKEDIKVLSDHMLSSFATMEMANCHVDGDVKARKYVECTGEARQGGM